MGTGKAFGGDLPDRSEVAIRPRLVGNVRKSLSCPEVRVIIAGPFYRADVARSPARSHFPDRLRIVKVSLSLREQKHIFM
jgi:hypothetical protein